jgi:hypothetical protein
VHAGLELLYAAMALRVKAAAALGLRPVLTGRA